MVLHVTALDTFVRFDAALAARYDRPGPRYTSYPTAVQFNEDFGTADYRAAVRASAEQRPDAPLSVYVHIPFCSSPCFYCGCSRVITRQRGQAESYLDRLQHEIAMQARLFTGGRRVEQLHLGGGTPTFLECAQLEALLGGLGAHFPLCRDERREFSIEVDPRTADGESIRRLAAMGFNRLSLGVQDFDPGVQRAVNRLQPQDETLAMIGQARDAGFRSVSVDLIYGLPRQTTDSFARTLDAVIGARPDRVAVYGYAHMPRLFKAQRRIREAELPDAAGRLALLGLSVARMTAAGYVYIGMDHFALPGDELARALEDGSLHRNFQGYSTRADCDLVGLGVTSIGSIGDCYAQNRKALPDYYAAVDADRLPVLRGLWLTDDDRRRRAVIQSIMCSTRVDYEEFGARWGVDFRDCYAGELAALQPLADDGLVELGRDGFRLTPAGRLLMRHVAMCFDAHLAAPDLAAGRYSRAV